MSVEETNPGSLKYTQTRIYIYIQLNLSNMYIYVQIISSSEKLLE